MFTKHVSPLPHLSLRSLSRLPQLLIVSGLLTLITAAPAPAPAPAPYPPWVAEPPAFNETFRHASFGNKHGNFQPTSTVKENPTGTHEKRDPSAYVTNGALANWNSANIDDGIGSGSDSYKMHWGAGRADEGWPVRSQWVSFRNMCVFIFLHSSLLLSTSAIFEI